jgi:hypothetical protein
MSPVRGFIAKERAVHVGGTQPAPMLTFEGIGNCRLRLVQIIVPFEGDAVPQVEATGKGIDSVLHLTITVNGETWRLAITAAMLEGSVYLSTIGDMAELTSDAQMALVCPASGFAWMYNGRRLALGDNLIMDHPTWGHWEN